MHICLATYEYPPFTLGGISTYYSNLAQLLVEQGHTVTVLTTVLNNDNQNEASTTTPQDESSALRVVRVDRTVRSRQDQLHRILPALDPVVKDSISNGLAMRDWLRSNAKKLGIDVIDVPDYSGYGAFFLEADLPPVVVSTHSTLGQFYLHSGLKTPPDRALVEAFEMILLSMADQAITHSQLNHDNLQTYLGRDITFTTTPFIVPESQPKSTPNSPLKGVVVGRLQANKGIYILVEALKKCVDNGLDVQIRWIGYDTFFSEHMVDRDNFSEEELRKQTRSYDIQQKYPDLWGKHFIWEGALPPEKVRELQQEADFAVVPSIWESFGYTMIESMSVGTPCIISDSIGASYLCEDGENSLVFASQDSDSLADAITRMASDPELRSTLSQNAFKMLKDEFTVANIVDKRIEVYAIAQQRHQYRRDNHFHQSILNPVMLHLFRIPNLKLTDQVLADETDSAQLMRILFKKSVFNRIGSRLRHFLARVRHKLARMLRS